MKIAKIIGIIVVSALAYFIGLAVMGALAPVLHLPTIKPLASVSPQTAILMMVLASPLLIIGMFPLASGLRGTWPQRCSAIAILLFVALGLNTILELKIFSTLLDGNPWLASLLWILPCALTAAVLTWGFAGPASAEGGFGAFGSTGWAWRLGLAWLSFPVIYFFFGMCVSPIVVPYYQSANELGLHIPAMPVILRTLAIRSATFLLASLPAIALWTKSRGRLIFALGLAHAMTVGIFPLAQSTFLPATMRVAHGIEIICDSFAYAAVLAILFARSAAVAKPVLAKEHAAA